MSKLLEKKLKAGGFIMFQFSVYMRYCRNSQNSSIDIKE
ncbi:CRISPR-associated endonuclease Cas2 [uncultured Tenacibaculum sp.]